MKVVSIWNPKGGQGKSMLAINLAAAAFDLGLKPLVICQDPQGTSSLFHREGGNLPFEVIPEVPEEKPDADIVIFDHQASEWELPPAQLVVMPTKPERSQYATYADAYKMAREAGKDVVTVVTDGNIGRKNEKATVMALRQNGAYEIRSSVAFSRAADEYRTIFDPALNKVNNIKERRMELQAILAAVLNGVNQSVSVEEQQEEAVYA
ncbi:MAG: ParA family protein [Gammaproteobacteria bacterium]|nr:ParA family protein [Gammaproteobacteria bacterium]